MDRYPVEIKGISKVAEADQKIFADLLRDVTYRFSGHARRGYRGFYDPILTSPFGFNLYGDTPEIQEQYCDSLTKFSAGFPQVRVRLRRSRTDRNKRDVYCIKPKHKKSA